MCGLNYGPDVKRNFSPSDSGGGADDWAIHWLIRTDGEVNKLHTQVITGFLLGYRGEWRTMMMMRRGVCACVRQQPVSRWTWRASLQYLYFDIPLKVPQSSFYRTKLAQF